MNPPSTTPDPRPAAQPTRREFLTTSGRLVAASALAGVALPHVHAADDNTLRLAIIGCGGRGTGAVANAFEAKGGPVKLHAMADVNEQKLNTSFQALSKEHAAQMDVGDRRFLGFAQQFPNTGDGNQFLRDDGARFGGF